MKPTYTMWKKNTRKKIDQRFF
jgi:hypothetical protein